MVEQQSRGIKMVAARDQGPKQSTGNENAAKEKKKNLDVEGLQSDQGEIWQVYARGRHG
jgi:hypothetical protein